MNKANVNSQPVMLRTAEQVRELNMNNYFAISDKKEGKNGNDEEALDGYDIEIGAHAPFMPTWKFYTKMFEFDVPSGKMGRIIQKFKEWVIATRLEKQYTKDEIIVLYLNQFDPLL